MLYSYQHNMFFSRKEHHLCEEPECESCFVAYNTTEELRQHRMQVSM